MNNMLSVHRPRRAPVIDVVPAQAGATIAELAVRPPVARRNALVDATRAALPGVTHETLSHVAVLADDGTLVGMVRMSELLAADPGECVGDLLASEEANIPMVSADTSRDEAAHAAVEAGCGEVAVVDSGGKLVGIVPAARMLAMLAREHADDLARISGYLHQGDSARSATNESTLRRFIHRLPWLLFGLGGAWLASLLVSSYERHLEQVVALAFFIPALVYLAGAVGSQTVTIVVRGLSVGVQLRTIAWREVGTGVLLGFVVGALFIAPAWVIARDFDVAVTVGVAFFVASALSNVIALFTPWLFATLGLDPAFGAGPMATMAQDLLSVFVYFTIASTMLGL